MVRELLQVRLLLGQLLLELEELFLLALADGVVLVGLLTLLEGVARNQPAGVGLMLAFFLVLAVSWVRVSGAPPLAHHTISTSHTCPMLDHACERVARVVCGLTVGPPCNPRCFSRTLGVTGDGAPALSHSAPERRAHGTGEDGRGSGYRSHGVWCLLFGKDWVMVVVVINLRLAQALGGSSRVAGSHDSGGDGEGSGAGRPGELGDGLTKHLDCVDGCKEEGWSGVED